MAHANQERWSKLVDAKLRNQLATRDLHIFGTNRYEGDPKAGESRSVRDTRSLSRTTTRPPAHRPRGQYHLYLELNIDQDEAVNSFDRRL